MNKQTQKQSQTYYYNVQNPSSKVACDVCQNDITKHVKISTEEHDYCVGCFAKLENYPTTYNVINKLNFPIFEPNWSAEEELLMMEGLQKYGFGSWSQISREIGTDKTPDKIEQHYQKMFLASPNFFENNTELLTRRDPKTMKLISSVMPVKTEIKIDRRTKQWRDQNRNTQKESKQQKGSPIAKDSKEKQGQQNEVNPTEVVGFMPKRGDFQVQYDNQAELLLAEMQFRDQDTPEQIEMKYQIIQIYNTRLTQRMKRKQFVISRKLLEVKLQTQLQRNRQTQDRQIYNAMKVFARFNPPQEHQKLVDGLIRQKQIRQRLQELRHYKKMGLKSLSQVQQYISQQKKRESKNKNNHKSGEGGFVFDKNIKSTHRRARGDVAEEKQTQKSNIQLTTQQTNLCQKAQITFAQFIVIKQTLIRESLKYGSINHQKFNTIFKIAKQKVQKVYDHLVKTNSLL